MHKKEERIVQISTIVDTKVQLPNSVPVIVNVNVTLNFVIVNKQPYCNGHICWQASLPHLRPSFSSTRMISRTIYVQDFGFGNSPCMDTIPVRLLN